MPTTEPPTSSASGSPADKCVLIFFFFQAEDGIRDVAVTGVQTCALPICPRAGKRARPGGCGAGHAGRQGMDAADRKSTRLNSSHGYISYAVFCLKKKKKSNTVYTICNI